MLDEVPAEVGSIAVMFLHMKMSCTHTPFTKVKLGRLHSTAHARPSSTSSCSCKGFDRSSILHSRCPSHALTYVAANSVLQRTCNHDYGVGSLQRLVQSMDNAEVDVVIYPTWSNPPRLIGDTVSADGNNSPTIAPHTGAPAITVPMGFNKAGMQCTIPTRTSSSKESHSGCHASQHHDQVP